MRARPAPATYGQSAAGWFHHRRQRAPKERAIRRANAGHTAAVDESTVPLKEIPAEKKAEVEKKVEETKKDEPKKKDEAKVEAKKDDPKKPAKDDPTEVVRTKGSSNGAPARTSGGQTATSMEPRKPRERSW